MEIIKNRKAIQNFKDMLNKDNFILFHGTNVKNAEIIMKTGLRMERTTTVSVKPTSDPLIFASYAWKDIPVEESANVIVEIPIKEIWSNILKGYDIDSWIEKIRTKDEEEFFTRTLLEKEENREQISLFDGMKTILPKHFIRGYTKLIDRDSYLTNPKDVDPKKIEFIENSEYFSNLGLVRQQQIINYYHNKYKKIMSNNNSK